MERRIVAVSWRSALPYATLAILAGGLFIAAAYYADAAGSWALEDRRLSGFLFVYGLTLAGAAPTLLAYAAALWALTRLVGWERAWQWLLAGGITGVVVPWMLAALGYALERWYFPADLQPLKRALVFPLIGPMMYASQPVWVRLSIGAVTAAPLWLVVRMRIRARDRRSRRDAALS